MADVDVTLQMFRETASRRVAEARALLDHPRQRRKDGAVVCALLAAECALKALLLKGHGLNSSSEALSDENKDLHLRSCFRGKAGHDLPFLRGRLHSDITAGCSDDEFDAVTALDARNRYEYRYGAAGTAIQRAHAEPLVGSADTLVAWMKRAAT